MNDSRDERREARDHRADVYDLLVRQSRRRYAGPEATYQPPRDAA